MQSEDSVTVSNQKSECPKVPKQPVWGLIAASHENIFIKSGLATILELFGSRPRLDQSRPANKQIGQSIYIYICVRGITQYIAQGLGNGKPPKNEKNECHV